MVLVTMETCHHHPGQNGNPSDDFELQSAEAARSGGDLVFSVPLKGCEVINTFTFFDILLYHCHFHFLYHVIHKTKLEDHGSVHL